MRKTRCDDTSNLAFTDFWARPWIIDDGSGLIVDIRAARLDMEMETEGGEHGYQKGSEDRFL